MAGHPCTVWVRFCFPDSPIPSLLSLLRSLATDEAVVNSGDSLGAELLVQCAWPLRTEIEVVALGVDGSGEGVWNSWNSNTGPSYYSWIPFRIHSFCAQKPTSHVYRRPGTISWTNPCALFTRPTSCGRLVNLNLGPTPHGPCTRTLPPMIILPAKLFPLNLSNPRTTRDTIHSGMSRNAYTIFQSPELDTVSQVIHQRLQHL